MYVIVVDGKWLSYNIFHKFIRLFKILKGSFYGDFIVFAVDTFKR